MQKALNILPGLLDKRVEFFAHDEVEVSALYNRHILSYEKIPQWAKDIIQKHKESHPEIDRWARNQPGEFGGDVLKKYIFYVFGALNSTPDIDLDGSVNHECFEFIFSRTQLAILRRVELPDKLIADQLFISKHTAESHWQNMRKKTGLNNKVEFAVMAVKQGII